MLGSVEVLYVKIARELCVEILSDDNPAGKKVPSVRELSKTKQVNANTVQKAYQYLDDLGLFVTEQGLGRFVTKDEKLIQDVKIMLVTSELQKIKEIAKKYDISDSDLCKMYIDIEIEAD